MDLDAVEICAGAGGQALGLERAGFEHALAVELDAAACATLRANRPGWKVAEGDVADPALWRPRDYRAGLRSRAAAPGRCVDPAASGNRPPSRFA